ncbi:MAG: PDZ domain-containing protein, partial [Chthoniobacterales bacterium]
MTKSLKLSALALLLGSTTVFGQPPTDQPVPAAPESEAEAPPPAPVPSTATTANNLSADSFVRVNATNQRYNFVRPWTKRPPFSRRGIGAVISDGRVLVTAELVGDHNSIELERPSDSVRSAATVDLIDYEANLALLRPEEPDFFANAVPVQLAGPLQVGDAVEIAQVEPNGSVATTAGVVTTIALSNYPVDGIGLLSYAISAPLQYRDNSFTVPLFYQEELAGLLMRYDSRSQTATVLPGPVIQTFLARAEESPYESFPRLGIAFSPTRDPQFRRYLEMSDDQTGVYLSKILRGSAAEKGDLEEGDVILSVEGNDIDSDGNYDDPDFGLISLGHLISNADPAKSSIPMTILRDGTTKTISLPLEPQDPASVISPPYLADEQPSFLVLGGVVFQELSRPFLEEWGSDWRSNAPQRLVNLDAFQQELPPDQGRIVFVSQVLPTDATIGYQDLN